MSVAELQSTDTITSILPNVVSYHYSRSSSHQVNYYIRVSKQELGFPIYQINNAPHKSLYFDIDEYSEGEYINYIEQLKYYPVWNHYQYGDNELESYSIGGYLDYKYSDKLDDKGIKAYDSSTNSLYIVV